MNDQSLMQSLTIVLSAIGVIAVIMWNRIIARRRATIDMLILELTNRDLLLYRSKFLEICGDSQKMLDLASADKWYTEDALPLVSVLNRYELMAIGIFEEIYDERIFKRYWRSGLVRDWIRCKGAVQLQRQVFTPRVFVEFEALALRWATPDERRRIADSNMDTTR